MKKGFTFIELLVVISLIGIISASILKVLNPTAQFNRARDSRRKTDLARLQAVLELYRSDQGSYPPSSGLSSCGSSSPLTFGGTTYLDIIPCDPSTNSAYTYTASPPACTTSTPCSGYSIIACLENVNDPQRDLPTSTSPPCTSGITNWSYTVKNP